MGQEDIMARVLQIIFFDETMMDLMNIPKNERNDIRLFRDKYCTQGFGTSEDVGSDVPVRMHMYWSTQSRTNSDRVHLRFLTFDIFVQRRQIYTAMPKDAPLSALKRRQDLITQRLRHLLHLKRVEGFLITAEDDMDANSNTLDYSRKFIDFAVKHIY